MRDKLNARGTLLLLLFMILFTMSVASAAAERVQVVNIPLGKSQAAALGQYDSYVVSFSAEPGDRLSIAFGVPELDRVFLGVADQGVALSGAGNLTPQLKQWQLRGTVTPSGGGLSSSLFAWLTDLGNGKHQLSLTNFSAEYTITPGVLLVHRDGKPIFASGQADRGQGLLALIDGNPTPLAAALRAQNEPSVPTPGQGGENSAENRHVHLFDKPTNSNTVSTIGPGQQYQVTFTATPGDHLSFATMLVETNDYFFSVNEWGVPLYDSNGQPRTSVLTKYVNMWDAGTEYDERPGSGANQPGRQPAPNSGAADANRAVRFANDKYGPIPLAGVEDIIDVFLKPTAMPNQFVLQITNVSGSKTLSPGIVLIHRDQAPLFSNGMPDYGDGLEALAEDGNPWPLSRVLSGRYD